ncbi:MAG: HAMP domain-containing histidine kinase [Myxococcales bacterium]|nr:HAMP domain-containing histidine kinase [Myxococcales bacterium]MBK7193626.1 HAMP domain-containing histidine kinase [Myxococcales bacterium]MBP6844538.1 HAMP domain-containing histidine kinase [Kofleriaceae bacterium]
MLLPPFVEELRHPAYRTRLLAGVWSGYLIAIAFALLAGSAVFFDLVPYGREFLILLVIKGATNTASLIALSRRWRYGLEVMSVNTMADVVCMTAAIYFTGGVQSPLFAIYVIEVGVVALLSNLGTTLLTAGAILLAYGTMCVLELTGALPGTAPPLTGPMSTWHLIVVMGYAAFAIGVPTFFTTRILRKLRDREAALEARTAELIDAGKQKSVFLASVTHELRTPIHGVSGLAELIASGVYGPPTERQRQAAQSIKQSAQSLLHLVDDLLALVRAEVGRVEIQATTFALRELVEQVTASVGWMLGTKQLTLATDVADAIVTTDRRLVSHVLVNLVANAAKFTPTGGRVDVRAHVAGDRLVLTVADTGVGIAAEDQQAIFEAFRQLDRGDERAYGGVGLGLALVKRLVDALGGTIAVVSAVGVGSTFTVELPPPPSRGAADDVELAGQRQTVESA